MGRHVQPAQRRHRRVGPRVSQRDDLRAGRRRAVIGQVDDRAGRAPLDGGVRLVDEAARAGAVPDPVIAPRLPPRAVHPLLHDDPGAVVGDDEPVQVQLEAVLDGGAVDLRDQAARLHQRRRVQAAALAQRRQLVGRAARVTPAPAADVQPQLVRDRGQPALQRADDAGRDPGRVPVHPHHGAERLEPERIREPPQHLRPPVGLRDRLDDHPAKPRHPRRQPGGHAPAMKRQIGGPGRGGHARQLATRHAERRVQN